MNWDSWRGSMDGRPVLWEKHLLCGRGYHIDLHKMIGIDDPDCFHTHPAYAIRIILYGGYIDEMESGRLRAWCPGMIGIVKPSLSHRVARLRNGRVSFSLWIRFRKCAKVHLRGEGWKKQAQTYRDHSAVIDGEITKMLCGVEGTSVQSAFKENLRTEKLNAAIQIIESAKQEDDKCWLELAEKFGINIKKDILFVSNLNFPAGPFNLSLPPWVQRSSLIPFGRCLIIPGRVEHGLKAHT